MPVSNFGFLCPSFFLFHTYLGHPQTIAVLFWILRTDVHTYQTTHHYIFASSRLGRLCVTQAYSLYLLLFLFFLCYFYFWILHMLPSWSIHCCAFDFRSFIFRTPVHTQTLCLGAGHSAFQCHLGPLFSLLGDTSLHTAQGVLYRSRVDICERPDVKLHYLCF